MVYELTEWSVCLFPVRLFCLLIIGDFNSDELDLLCVVTGCFSIWLHLWTERKIKPFLFFFFIYIIIHIVISNKFNHIKYNHILWLNKKLMMWLIMCKTTTTSQTTKQKAHIQAGFFFFIRLPSKLRINLRHYCWFCLRCFFAGFCATVRQRNATEWN